MSHNLCKLSKMQLRQGDHLFDTQAKALQSRSFRLFQTILYEQKTKSCSPVTRLELNSALDCSFIFWKEGGHVTTQMGITNVLGALYASVIFLGIINSIVLQPIAAENRGVLYRERAAGRPRNATGNFIRDLVQEV